MALSTSSSIDIVDSLREGEGVADLEVVGGGESASMRENTFDKKFVFEMELGSCSHGEFIGTWFCDDSFSLSCPGMGNGIVEVVFESIVSVERPGGGLKGGGG
mmetsp:Transcript_16726/g.34482  ORF Transcript_16726/g.34482 Transcript_16726/m.34482 type:complete len:103 (-) Transcript_16726:63-371(-)